MTVVSGRSYGSTVIFSRPNDTTNYSAGQIIGTAKSAGGGILALPTVGPPGVDELFITSTTLMIGATSIPSGMTSFTLQLYRSSPGSAYQDGDAWDLPSGDRDAYLGALSLGSIVDVGATLFIGTDWLNKQITMGGNAGGNLWAYLVTGGGFTPAAETQFRVGVHGFGF